MLGREGNKINKMSVISKIYKDVSLLKIIFQQSMPFKKDNIFQMC